MGFGSYSQSNGKLVFTAVNKAVRDLPSRFVNGTRE